MKLEFEPNVATLPLVENELIDDTGIVPDVSSMLKNAIRSAQNGDRKHARQLLQEVIDVDVRNEEAWMWMASISEYPEQLLAALDHVLAINPTNGKAVEWRAATCSLLAKTFTNRATLALESGSVDVAKIEVEQALQHDAECVPALLLKARFAETPSAAAEIFRSVLGIEPDSDAALAALAEFDRSVTSAVLEDAKHAAKNGETDRALFMLDDYLAKAPDSFEGWMLKSHLTPDVDQKLHALESALEVDPNNEVARASYDFLLTTVGPLKDAEVGGPSKGTENLEDTDPPAAPLETFEHETQSVLTLPAIDGFDAVTVGTPNDDNEHSGEIEVLDVEQYTQNDVEAEVDWPVNDELSEQFVPEPSTADLEPEESAQESFETQETEFATTEMNELPAPESGSEDFDPYKTITFQLPEAEATMVETEEERESRSVPFEVTPEKSVAASELSDEVSAVCPFCGDDVGVHAIECSRCRSALTLSDIESLLSNNLADKDVVRQAILDLEAEWVQRDLDQREMINLSLGHLILGDLDAGFRCLQIASERAPNDVVLSAQLNKLAIRSDEIKRQAEVRETRHTGRSILVVDDSATVRKLIASKLEKSGHYVTCAVDGMDALAKLDEQVPDLVLLDISMPNMDGYEVCKHIRSRPDATDLPVVMISGKDGFFDKVRGKMAGTTAFITKPFGPETLMKALEAYLLPNNNNDGGV